MKKQFTVLVIFTVVIVVILCGCRVANKVPGVSAVGSAVASVIPSLSPLPSATQNPSGATTMPITSASALVSPSKK